MTGIVSNVIVTKKYGFISGDNGQEYFFHALDAEGWWDGIVSAFSKVGGGKVKVDFEAVKTPKGPRAKNVALIDLS